MNSRINVKEENVTILPLGKLDDCKENSDFEQNEIMPRVRAYATVCQCQRAHMAMTYAATNRNPIIRGKSIGPVVRQEDIDTLRFGVVATVDNGKYSNVAVVIVQCSECKKLTFYGQLPAALNMFAIGIEDYYSGSATQPTLPTDGNEAAVELEDIESGDIAPVPDVLKPLLKKANGPGELHDSPSSSPTNELNRT